MLRFLKMFFMIPDKTKRQREKEQKEKKERMTLSKLGIPGISGLHTKEDMERERKKI